jgi:hypothetical protein
MGGAYDFGFYLLDEACRHIITYLDWVTHDLARGRRWASAAAKSRGPPSACWRSRLRFALFWMEIFEIKIAVVRGQAPLLARSPGIGEM